MPTINISVNNRIATQTNDVVYVCGNSDYEVKFAFDEALWTSSSIKTARFTYKNKYQDVVFTGDSCTMPVIEDALLIGIGVFTGNISTTSNAIVRTVHGASESGRSEDIPSENIYDKIIELADDAIEQIVESTDGLVAEINNKTDNTILAYNLSDPSYEIPTVDDLTDGTKATAKYHLGFYFDENNDLCQEDD